MRREGKPSRLVKTLSGHVAYKDSSWTAAEWALIQSAMAKCTGVEDTRTPRRQKRKSLARSVTVTYRCPNCNGPHARKECPLLPLF